MKRAELLAYLKKQGFSKKIIAAFASVAREDFIDLSLASWAYADQPLPLAPGATISQPYTIAFMLDLLELADGQKILEVGSGSGYVLALLNHIVPKARLYGVEILEDLAVRSARLLSVYRNIKIIAADGRLGWLDQAPYDRILVSAASDTIPEHLYSQLDTQGVLVCPVRNSIYQIKMSGAGPVVREFPGFAFVPLVGSNKKL